MAPRYDEAPEVTPDVYPEVHYPPSAPEVSHAHGGGGGYSSPNNPAARSPAAATATTTTAPAPSVPPASLKRENSYGTYNHHHHHHHQPHHYQYPLHGGGGGGGGYSATTTGTFSSTQSTPVDPGLPPFPGGGGGVPPPAPPYGAHQHHHNPYDQRSLYPPTSTTFHEPLRRRPTKRRGRRVLGCSLLVFTLSAVIAALSVAVIGLAAGAGVATSRADTAERQLASAMASASATATSSSAPPAATSSADDDVSAIDGGCSDDPSKVTGSTYTSKFYNRPSFKRYCNSDTPNGPLYSLFVGNYDDCIDACASWTYYSGPDFSGSGSADAKNQTCAGVSFIPAWTNRTFADDGDAPGNCYLKPGPITSSALTTPNIGSDVHAAVLQK